jgi:hypothetical protein
LWRSPFSYDPGQGALFHAFYANRILSAAGMPVKVGFRGGLSYLKRGDVLLASVKTWGTEQAAQPKPIQTGLVYSLNW